MERHESPPVFKDRADAGRTLGRRLGHLSNEQPVVLALPRGGVPVAVEVAGALAAPLDLLIARKIQIPYNPEAGYGAVAEDGSVTLNEPLVARLRLSQEEIGEHAQTVRAEIARRSERYRRVLPPVDISGKACILVDDGLASGYTMLAAIESAQRRGAARMIAAVPAASRRAYELVQSAADEVISIIIAEGSVFAVANYYLDWYDLDDDEVIRELKHWRSSNPQGMHR